MIEHRADISTWDCSLLIPNNRKIDIQSEGASYQFVALRATL
jgi:hypothetical protein